MEYIKATEKDIEQIEMLVQDTIRTIYPKYYPKDVVDFFANFIVKKIYSKILKMVSLVFCNTII